MKKYALITAFFPLLCFAQQEVLGSFFTRLEQNTLQAQFYLTVSDESNQPMHFNGSITMRGDKFNFQMGDIEVSYDGTTLYHYDEGLDELTLSTPTLQEITESNPLLYAKAISEQCTAQYSAKTDENNYVIELIPNDAAMGVSIFTITLRKTDLMPLSAVMKENIHSYTTLELKQPMYISDIPTFTLEKEDADINDLR